MENEQRFAAMPGQSQQAFKAKQRELGVEESEVKFDPVPQGAKICGSCTGYGSCGNKKFCMGEDGQVVAICNNPNRK